MYNEFANGNTSLLEELIETEVNRMKVEFQLPEVLPHRADDFLKLLLELIKSK